MTEHADSFQVEPALERPFCVPGLEKVQGCDHVLGPTTGYPADSGLISVSIVSGNSLMADALSTILFVAGMKKGLEFLRCFPQTEAIFVDSDVQVYVTQGLSTRFQADKDVVVTTLDR